MSWLRAGQLLPITQWSLLGQLGSLPLGRNMPCEVDVGHEGSGFRGFGGKYCRGFEGFIAGTYFPLSIRKHNTGL